MEDKNLSPSTEGLGVRMQPPSKTHNFGVGPKVQPNSASNTQSGTTKRNFIEISRSKK